MNLNLCDFQEQYENIRVQLRRVMLFAKKTKQNKKTFILQT